MLRYNPASLHAARTDEGKITDKHDVTIYVSQQPSLLLPITDVNVQFIW